MTAAVRASVAATVPVTVSVPDETVGGAFMPCDHWRSPRGSVAVGIGYGYGYGFGRGYGHGPGLGHRCGS